MSFLSALLPAIEGAAVMAGGAAMGVPIDPSTAAMLVGAGNYAATGSIGKGLTAGLGAYGGAGLANGITPEMMATKGGETAANTTTQATQQLAEQEAAHQTALNQAQTDFLNQPLSNDPTKYNFANIDRTNAVVGYDKAADAYMNTPNAVTEANLARASSSLPAGSGGMSMTPTPSISDTLAKNATFKNVSMAAGPVLADAMTPKKPTYTAPTSTDLGLRYSYDPGTASPFPQANAAGEQTYFPKAGYTRISPTESKALYGFAAGGDIQGDPNMMDVRTYDPVVRMADGGMYSGAISDLISQMQGSGAFAPKYNYDPNNQTYTRVDTPPAMGDMSADSISQAAPDAMQPQKLSYSPETQTYTKMARGGLSDLGGYSDGGRLLRGPGDGVSDSIPATIGHKQPARLADGEFVVPARIVSELGNGSTEAGARQLYAMMDRVQKARGKTTGKDKVARNTRAAKYLPA